MFGCRWHPFFGIFNSYVCMESMDRVEGTQWSLISQSDRFHFAQSSSMLEMVKYLHICLVYDIADRKPLQ